MHGESHPTSLSARKEKKRKVTPLKNQRTEREKKTPHKRRERERPRSEIYISKSQISEREREAIEKIYLFGELARRAESERWKRKVMAWWQKRILFPVKRAWLHLSSRVRPRTDANDGGILKLHGDVQTCEYQDVQVMWEILRSEMEVSNSVARQQQKHTFWRMPAWPHRQSNTDQ